MGDRYMHGKTCAECMHFPRCQFLVGALETWTSCDWSPPRFRPADASKPIPRWSSAALPSGGPRDAR